MTSNNVGRVSDSVTRQIETENVGLRDKAEIYEWNTKPLGELLELIIDHRGKTPNKMGFDDFHSYGHPVLSAKHVKTDKLVNIDAMRFANENMYKKWMKVEVQKGDVALTSEAPMGEVFYLDGKVKYVLGQRIFGLRVKKELIAPLYLTAWLTSRRGQEQLAARASGSTVLGIKQSELLKIEVDVPPYEVQVEIAKVRYNLSKKIELNHQINQTLEQMAQALFKSWFVDFDPVKAKISAKDAWINLQGEIPATDSLIYADYAQSLCTAAMSVISGKTTAQLEAFATQNPEQYQSLKATADLFPDAMQDSELGDVPGGWEVVAIRDFGKVITGKTPPQKIENAYTDSGFPFITPTDVDDSLYVSTTNRYLSEDGAEAVKKSKIESGSICVTCIGSQMGKTVIAPYDSYTNQQINSIVISKSLWKNYLFLNLRNRRQEIFLIGSSGSTMPIINKSTFENLSVLKPSDFVLSGFNLAVGNLLTNVYENNVQSITLASIRDALLPKLLSGEITIQTME